MHTALKNLWASVAIDAGAVLDRDRSGAGDLTLETSGLRPADRSRPSDLTLAGWGGASCDYMIDFACVSSTTPTWSNDPRWCIPGIAATEAEHAKLAADRASSAPVQGVHRYYPFVVEDRGRLGKSALTVVYIFAVLLAVRNFPGGPWTSRGRPTGKWAGRRRQRRRRRRRQRQASKMYVNKWVTLSAAAFTQLSAGLPYCFSVYSEQLKDHFNWNQTQLQTVGFACSLGAYLGVISGLFYDNLRAYNKLGPRLTLLVGMFMNVVGFTALWAAGSGVINPPLWQVAVFAWIAHNNGTWFDTSSMVTIVRNFPNHRGTVVGAMKSITGISGAVYVQVYLGFFSPKAIQFLLFLALAPFCICCVTILFLNHVPYVTTSEGHNTSRRLLFMYGVIITLACYVTATALWQGIMPVPQHVRRWITVGMGALLLPLMSLSFGTGGLRAQPMDPKDPLAEPSMRLLAADEEEADREGNAAGLRSPLLSVKPPEFRVEDEIYSPTDSARLMSANASRASSRYASPRLSQMPSRDNLPELARVAEAERSHDNLQNHVNARLGPPAEPEPELTPLEPPELPEYSLGGAILTMDFWLLGVSAAVGMGSGLVLNNNLAQVVQALGGAKDGQGIHVSLFAVANCFGRLLAGYLPQYALNNAGIVRPWFLALLGLMTSGSAFFNAFASLRFMIIGTILTGISFGCHWTLLATLTSEVFGLKYFATIYKLLSLAPSIGGYLLATLLAGNVYDAHVEGKGNDCHGRECFRETFLVCSALSLIEVAAGVILVFRTRHIYKALLQHYKPN
eukprot:jgi/Tetstr1/426875/TSEL_017089.t1